MERCRICMVTGDPAAWLPLLAPRIPAHARLVETPTEAEVLVGSPAEIAPLLDGCPQVRWVQSTFAGVDALMRPGSRRDYRLSRVTGIFGPAMAEWTLGRIIARERGFADQASQQRQRIWQPRSYRLLSSLHLGLGGLGGIGSQVAAVARRFGMTISGYSRSGRGPDGITCYGEQAFADFLRDPDYFLFTLPDTPSTRGLVDARALSLMKPGAVVINAGRGSLIDEQALCAALRNGHIGGAILDVAAREPLPSDHPLWDCPNCVISPHCAAISFPAQIVDYFLANLDAYVRGETLRGEVDFGKGY